MDKEEVMATGADRIPRLPGRDDLVLVDAERDRLADLYVVPGRLLHVERDGGHVGEVPVPIDEVRPARLQLLDRGQIGEAADTRGVLVDLTRADPPDDAAPSPVSED